MADTPIHFQSIRELGEQIRDGRLSPVDLTQIFLDRIDALDDRLHAFISVTRERALAEAKAAELQIRSGSYRGPLHGIPYAVKDLYDVAGQATGAGSSVLADRIAKSDCESVQRLARAGMVLLGKTHTVQFAFGGVGINHDTNTPHNPWHEVAHAPGGSSSGSAVAVASAMAPMALGTDTGGSVRIPAGLCGIAGLKTTVGRISRQGVYPLSYSLDSVGPLARTVEDCAYVYEALQGEDRVGDDTTIGQTPHDVRTTLEHGVRGLRLAFAETAFWDDVDEDVARLVRDTGKVFESLGAEVRSIEVPEAREIVGGERERHRALMIAAEACAFNRDLLENHFERLDPRVAERMRNGFNLSASDYFETQRIWSRLRHAVDQRFEDVDALLVPTTMVAAKPIDVIDESMETYASWNGMYLRNTAIGNMLGLCATTTPCGFDGDGLPVGLMVYARAFREDTALRVAHAYERATEWHQKRAPIS
jgi:aspartyl-tRNA(Asn)/glutamyl-tRNA(Gln) amidotransferase subunit A